MNTICRSKAQPKENQQLNRKPHEQNSPHHRRKTEHHSKEEVLRGDQGSEDVEAVNGEQEEDVEAAREKSSHKSCKKTDESDFHRLTFIRSSRFRYSWFASDDLQQSSKEGGASGHQDNQLPS